MVIEITVGPCRVADSRNNLRGYAHEQRPRGERMRSYKTKRRRRVKNTGKIAGDPGGSREYL